MDATGLTDGFFFGLAFLGLAGFGPTTGLGDLLLVLLGLAGLGDFDLLLVLLGLAGLGDFDLLLVLLELPELLGLAGFGLGALGKVSIRFVGSVG